MLTQNYLILTEKLKTASGKYGINMVTWSYLMFAVNVIFNPSNVFQAPFLFAARVGEEGEGAYFGSARYCSNCSVLVFGLQMVNVQQTRRPQDPLEGSVVVEGGGGRVIAQEDYDFFFVNIFW